MNNLGIKFKIMTIAIVGLLGLGIMSAYMLNSIAKTRAKAEYSGYDHESKQLHSRATKGTRI